MDTPTSTWMTWDSQPADHAGWMERLDRWINAGVMAVLTAAGAFAVLL